MTRCQGFSCQIAKKKQEHVFTFVLCFHCVHTFTYQFAWWVSLSVTKGHGVEGIFQRKWNKMVQAQSLEVHQPRVILLQHWCLRAYACSSMCPFRVPLCSSIRCNVCAWWSTISPLPRLGGRFTVNPSKTKKNEWTNFTSLNMMKTGRALKVEFDYFSLFLEVRKSGSKNFIFHEFEKWGDADSSWRSQCVWKSVDLFLGCLSVGILSYMWMV